MAYHFDTPDRVLKRVQQLEDMELPSLPSFQHDDIEYDSMSGAETSRDDYHYQQKQGQSVSDIVSQEDVATPHPLRAAAAPRPSSTITGTTRSSADSFSTASGSPFPPVDASLREGTPSPYAPAAALTSTPQSRQMRSLSRSILASSTVTADQTATTTSKASRHERTRSGTGSLGNSTHASRRERWQTPGEMSGSFSGDEIVDSIKLGTEKSVPLNDDSEGLYNESHSQSLPELPSLTAPPEETPVTRRLSSANVLFERPRKRGPSATIQQLEAVLATPSDLSTPSGSQTSVVTALPIQQNDRIPSLSRSEVSGTDVSEAASTPEGPVRNVSMMTPRLDAHQEYEVTGEYQYDLESEGSNHGENPTWVYNQDMDHMQQEDQDDSGDLSRFASPSKAMDTYSPAKMAITPSMTHYSTPGTVRGQPFREDSYNSVVATTTVLHDITNSAQNTPSAPLTPSPFGMASKNSEVSTPRAHLDDAARRKSHVLAVLSSSGSTSRVMRPQFRGTPHPLRRVSTAPDTESIAEEGSSMGDSQRSMHRAVTPGATSRLTIDQSADQSFVSVASSADLTSDKRASHLHSRLSRGNTSFPTILLPTTPSSVGGGSLKGFSDQRADGIKIHKHLNAMNKQLLESNADLAREAEAWKYEVEKLRGILEDHDIDCEESNVLGKAHGASTSANISQQLPEWPANSPGGQSGRDNPRGDHTQLISQLSSLSGRKDRSPHGQTSVSAQDLLDGLTPEEYAAVMQEMAEKLESLEEGLDEKDQMISDLQDQLQAAIQSGSPEQNELHDEIDRLSLQLEQADEARVAQQTEFSTKTEQHAKQFGEICSSFEDQVRGLEKELDLAKDEADRLRSDKHRLESLSSAEGREAREQELRKQVQDLETELEVSKEQSRERATEVENLNRHSTQLLEEKEALMLRIETAESKVQDLQQKLDDKADKRLTAGSEEVEAMKNELKAACEAQTAAEDELSRHVEEVATIQQTVSDQEDELDRQHEQIEHLNKVVEALEADLASAQYSSENNEQAEEELRHVQQELQEVHDVLAAKESEVEMLKGKLEIASIATEAIRTSQRRSTSTDSTATPTVKTPGPSNSPSNQDSFVAAIEERLDEAYREIGRLKHELIATPHRKSAIEVRDARIQALEREKAALADRLASGRSMVMPSTPVPAGVQDAGSPFKRPTPLMHKAIVSLRTPRTPGPMGELSWLQTTIGDSNEPILQAQLEYLQNELQDANDQLDHNFSRLESAGIGSVALAEKLAAAEERIGELEDEIRTLIQRNKASLALVSAQKEERERDNEGRMQKALNAVHQQMEELKSDVATERSRLQRDNGRLQNLVSEMKLKGQAEVDSFRSEMARIAETAEADVAAAQADLADSMKERDELKKSIQNSTAKIAQLERDVDQQQRAYEAFSRRNAQASQNSTTTIELNQKNQMVQSLHTTLRDVQEEADRLRDTLSERTRSLEDTQSRLVKFQNERQHVMKELEDFERDLQVQRAESKEFGSQLLALRKEQDNTSRHHQSELQTLERELREARELEHRTSRALADVKSRFESIEQWRIDHRCDSSQALIDQKARFKTQSRSLASQIRYLKAKYTRESTFRNALSLQKRYLLLLVGGMSLDQQATLRTIAQMGYPVPEPPRPKRTLKAVALAVLSIVRAKHTAKSWREEKQLKAESVIKPKHAERRSLSSRT
ncbi:uncharacterized protein IL334_005916 [Kwoniella shivajii]|uniref:Pericentrin/AKAP-450 centrosomal targeting domain-containing protein n=1 Tax=Kwoniella shivajii TaxID=564305 RepID=A0ABZ1D4G3_9TREE|nr:hypothetical protein IL334_005916 [Kwoniella shivajii]